MPTPTLKLVTPTDPESDSLPTGSTTPLVTRYEFATFPPEVRLIIISHWAADATHRLTSCGFEWPLSMFAALSREWQTVVEKHTFADITLMTRDLLSGTAMMYLSHRLGLVKQLGVKVTFSDLHFDEQCPCPDCIINTLFTLLEPAPIKRSYPHINLSIKLEFCSGASRHTAGQRIGRSQPICFRTSMDEQCLPEIPTVRSLAISAPYGLLFSPSCACRIASSMTRLVAFMFTGNWWNPFQDRPAKLEERERFAQSVELLPESLKDVSVNYVDWVDPHNLLADDKLSRALCKLSRRENLTSFSAKGSVGLSIFDSSDVPYTRNLNLYYVNFHCPDPGVDSTFFGRMSERGASVTRLLPREALVKLEYDDCYMIYENGKLYYCKNEWDEPRWDVEHWERTALYHTHKLILRLNKSPSDDEETDYSDDDPDDELDEESNTTPGQDLAEGLDDDINGIDGPSPDSSSTTSW